MSYSKWIDGGWRENGRKDEICKNRKNEEIPGFPTEGINKNREKQKGKGGENINTLWGRANKIMEKVFIFLVVCFQGDQQLPTVVMMEGKEGGVHSTKATRRGKTKSVPKMTHLWLLIRRQGAGERPVSTKMIEEVNTLSDKSAWTFRICAPTQPRVHSVLVDD